MSTVRPIDIVDEKGCTIWFKEKLKSPVMIECEAIMIDSGEQDNENPTYRRRKKIQYWRDGEIIYDFVDEDPYLEGWFGFRTVRSLLRLDNFRVYRLSD